MTTTKTEPRVDWDQLNGLRLKQTVLIRRTSGAEQKARVVALADGREYMAPELATFQVEFLCDATIRPMRRWCTAFDLLPYPEGWAMMVGY